MKTLNENDKLVVITDPQQIMDKLTRDGDLRDDDQDSLEIFECHSDDDLGFYQQGCEFLITRLASQSLVSDNKIAGLEAENKKLKVWEHFASHLVDHCEGAIITEEGIQQELAAVCKKIGYKSYISEREDENNALKENK